MGVHTLRGERNPIVRLGQLYLGDCCAGLHGVHEDVEEHEGGQAGDGQLDPGQRDEVQEPVLYRGPLVLERDAAGVLGVHPPDDGGRVDEGVDLEVDAEAEDHAGQPVPPPLDGPEQGRGEHAQEALGAAPGADGGDHGVPEPEGGEGAAPFEGHAAAGLEHAEEEPPRE